MTADHIAKLQKELTKRIGFITKYEALGESHMVDFLVSDHWNTFVHPIVQEQLLCLEEADLCSSRNTLNKLKLLKTSDHHGGTDHLIQNLEYFAAADSCKLSATGFCRTAENVLSEIGQFVPNEDTHLPDQSLISTKEYMCMKKSHEVAEMSKLVRDVCNRLNMNDILDLGSGKGYLGAYLALRYGFRVTGVDCSESNSSSASLRAKKYLKYWNASLKNKLSDGSMQEEHCKNLKYLPVTALVDDQSDISSYFDSETYENLKRMMLTGLHTCGDLCCTCLRTFVNTKDIKAVCAVGCCYHQLTVSKPEDETPGREQMGFPMSAYLSSSRFTLGRNTRLLGLKAPEKAQSTEFATIEEKSTRSLFYRAVLSVILQEELGQDCRGNSKMQVGKTYSKSKDFPDYVKRCLKKLGISDEEHSLDDDKILSYFNSSLIHRKSLLAFNMLREAFAPAVEAVILLDRLLYLEEQKTSENWTASYLLQLFDPVKSPRCYAIVAVKRDT